MPSDALKTPDLAPALVGWRGEAMHDSDAELARQNRAVARQLAAAGLLDAERVRAALGDESPTGMSYPK